MGFPAILCIPIETLKKKGLEVIYMCDPIDEYVVQQLKYVFVFQTVFAFPSQ